MKPMDITATAFAQVVEASIAASVLALIVLVIQFALRSRLTPAWRFALWLPVLLRLLLPSVPESPVSLFNLPRWTRIQPASSPPNAVMLNSPPVVLPTEEISKPIALHALTPTAAVSAPWSTFSTVQFLAIVWIVGAAILLSRLALGSLWFHFRLSRKRIARKPQLAELLARLRAEQNLRVNPDIIETPLVTSPCLFGLFKPRLLLPADLHSHLTQSELSHVVLHELAHLKRGDLFTNLFISLAHSIHWFNPIVWFVSRRMRLERELACDQFVLQSRSATDARAYGQTLLKLLQDVTSNSNSSAPALVGIAEDKHSATIRLSQIAKFKPGPARFSRFGSALILLLAVCGLTNAQKNQGDAKDSDAAATPNFAQKIVSSAAPQKYGIEALEREYAQQRKVVDEALNKLNKIRIDLGIVEVTNGTPADTTIKEIDAIQAAIVVTRERFATDTAMLDYLKKRERADIRKALPTMLRPPDEPLNRFLEDLGKTEQQLVSLAPNFSEEHPEVRRLREVAAKIEHQIEDRIDGILMGLEARKSVYETLLKNLKSEIDSKVEESSRRPEKYMPYFAAKRSLEDAQRILDTIFMRLLAEKVDSQSTK